MKTPTPRRFLLAAIAAAVIAAAIPAHAQSGLARHKKIYAVPRANPIAIDGDLKDWDLSGQIDMYVLRETREVQGAKFALMYDDQALYIGAEVRDQTPLMNRHDPATDAAKSWDADACQFRIVLDAKQGYPVNEGMDNPRPNDQMVSMTLWNYTDRNEPNLQLSYGMSYAPPKAAYPQGVVPRDKFQAAYKMMPDKRGYAFEYRIPWSTLEAKTPPKAGDIVASTVQFNWGTADGNSTPGTGGWAYDVMSGPGFAFQTSSVWGKAIFTGQNNLPRELSEINDAPAAPPAPLTFAYDLPKSGEVTIALLDNTGQIRRTLLAQEKRKAGRNVEKWDGLDDEGHPLPPGEYSWRGLYHDPITTRYLLGVHNSGHPSYATPDGKGAWGGDHGTPQSVAVTGDGVLLSWSVAEAGWGIIKTDLNGRKQWGIRASAQFLATDGARIFAAGGAGFTDGGGVVVYDIRDGRPLTFGRGTPKVEEPHGAGDNAVSGLAYGAGKLYVSYRNRNAVVVYDPKSGGILESLDVPSPGRLVVNPDGSALVLSGNKVVNVYNDRKAMNQLFPGSGDATQNPPDEKAPAEKPAPGEMSLTLTGIIETFDFATTHLDNPAGIALDKAGNVYVSNGGALQNVSVFSPKGKYLRSIGKAGGRPARGKFDPAGMLSPGGIAIDAAGKLWVAETLDYPKRISVWSTQGNAAGKLWGEFFGAGQYATFASMDAKHEDRVYSHMTEWKVNLDKGTWSPLATMWRATKPNEIAAAHEYLKVITAKNGHQFAWGRTNYGMTLFMKQGDVWKPIVCGLDVSKGNAYVQWPEYPIFADNAKYPNGAYMWQDKNGDATIQENEVAKASGERPEKIFNWVDADLNLWSEAGVVTRPLRLEKDGRPVYDFSKPERFFRDIEAGNMSGGMFPDPSSDGSFYTVESDRKPGFARWSREGKLMWGTSRTSAWHDALNKPIPRPGDAWGATAGLGVAGDFTGMATYFGPFHLWTRDGLYVAKLFKDTRQGEMGPDVINAEAFAGYLVKLEKSGKYVLLAGDTDGRATQILGLDSIKRFNGKFQLTSAQTQQVMAARAEYSQQQNALRPLDIVRGKAAIDISEGVHRTLEGGRGFGVKAAYDAQNLYLKYDVQAPHELVNSVLDPNTIFKGGNLLDIQIATDPNADAKRTAPAAGDVRVLVTRQVGQLPVVVVFRPHVAGFKGEPIVLKSPTGQESFDAIETDKRIGLEYSKTPTGFSALVTIPLDAIGLKLQAGQKVRMDVGYLFGSETGNQISRRSYWSNNSQTSGIIGDVPSESRLEPSQWGTALVE